MRARKSKGGDNTMKYFIELPILFSQEDNSEDHLNELLGVNKEAGYNRDVGMFNIKEIRSFNRSNRWGRENVALYLRGDEFCYVVDMSYEKFKSDILPQINSALDFYR